MDALNGAAYAPLYILLQVEYDQSITNQGELMKELTPQQTEVLDQLAQVHASIQVESWSDTDSTVKITLQSFCRSCDGANDVGCERCNGTGLVPDSNYVPILVGPGGVINK